MPDEKEIQRLMGIAQGHARAALAKPVTQRESHLAFCRMTWKRYAAGISKSESQCERFAEALDRATRDLIALAEDPSNPSQADWQRREGRRALDDSVEGAMESILVYEAAIEPPVPEAEPEIDATVEPAVDPTADPTVDPTVDPASASEISTGIPLQALPEPAERSAEEVAADTLELARAEEEDRLKARYSFAGMPQEPPKPAEIERPEYAGELQRKAREVLRALKDKSDGNS